jgi:membrane-bound lytic murein transglycosylase A
LDEARTEWLVKSKRTYLIRLSSRVGGIATLLWLCACVFIPPPGVGEAVSWDQLPGWSDEHHAEAWPALLADCKTALQRDASWMNICIDAALLGDPSDAAARAFFETHFTPHALYADDGKSDGLITGYYEPLLNGSRTPSERFRYPIYARPDDLLIIDLGEVYPELKGKRLRGRVEGKRVVPYLSRTQIENGKRPVAKPIVWVDDVVSLSFLHVQGSGRVRLPNGDMLFVGYADQNGHPYRSLGRRLVDMGVMKLDDVTMQSVRAWLAANPDQVAPLLSSNPSYIFFEERANDLPGPLGALKAPLLPERSIAVDPAFVPLGAPVWLDTTLPEQASMGCLHCMSSAAAPYRRLVFAQDTGGAIKGSVRADVFFGFGERAEDIAGKMKQPGRMYVLLPTTRLVVR